jgi:hypothetical protein
VLSLTAMFWQIHQILANTAEILWLLKGII